MRPPGRRLTPEEAALWAQVAQTVRPLERRRRAVVAKPVVELDVVVVSPALPQRKVRGRVPPSLPAPVVAKPAGRILDQHGLDASWDRQLAKGLVSPDFTLDLHGATLDAAHSRLDHGLTLAASQGARLVLLITGKSRPVAGPAARGNQRGASRAKVMDWLS